jgi:YHS domain-containing protein
MANDPVCGARVNENKAPATSLYQDERYVFCGQECKDKFDETPEQYAKSKESMQVTQ